MSAPRWLKHLLCRHSWYWNQNIYGDQIIALGWKRSIWHCAKCDAVQLRDYLVHSKGIPEDCR
jgi:hypothetical protein